MKKIFIYLVFTFFMFTAQANTEPVLTVKNNQDTKTYTLTELLKRKDIENIIIPKDLVYGNSKREYTAIKAAALFQGMVIDDKATIQFQTTDGFSAPIAKDRLLNQSSTQSIAYVALEHPNNPWGNMTHKKASAGPFYLVWVNPELSKIGQEEWPYMLAGFTVMGSLESTYPAIFPDKKLAKNDPVNAGFDIFVRQCFACHTMNHAGAGVIGPDLNLPMNPTQYFLEPAFKQFLRSPKSVRDWPERKMMGFSESQMSNQDMDNLIAYLKHMAAKK